MLLVKTYLAPSPIHGIGLFAGEEIKKGTVTWRHDPIFDIGISQEQLDALPDIQASLMRTYLFFSEPHKMYILLGDNARFINHSENPNICYEAFAKGTVASCDIAKGEELTEDYETFEGRPDFDLTLSKDVFELNTPKWKKAIRPFFGILKAPLKILKRIVD